MEGQDIKDIKKMEWKMDMVNYTLEMEDFIKVNGKIIWCMDMENYIIRMVKLLIKVNG